MRLAFAPRGNTRKSSRVKSPHDALHLAQAQSNRAAGGRKRDFPDAERLVKRLVAQELTLSFVPDAEQRLWRTVMRRKLPDHSQPRATPQRARIFIQSIGGW